MVLISALWRPAQRKAGLLHVMASPGRSSCLGAALSPLSPLLGVRKKSPVKHSWAAFSELKAESVVGTETSLEVRRQHMGTGLGRLDRKADVGAAGHSEPGTTGLE